MGASLSLKPNTPAGKIKTVYCLPKPITNSPASVPRFLPNCFELRGELLYCTCTHTVWIQSTCHSFPICSWSRWEFLCNSFPWWLKQIRRVPLGTVTILRRPTTWTPTLTPGLCFLQGRSSFYSFPLPLFSPLQRADRIGYVKATWCKLGVAIA